MPFLSREFIAVPDENKGQILFKWPDDEIRRKSRVIIEPDMLGLFVARGEVLGTLAPGHHVLEAGELPGLGALQDVLTGGNAYRTEMYFVGTHEYTSQKFGGRIDDVQDPQSQLMVGLRVFGDYSLLVLDPAKLVLQLTGTVDVADNTAVTGWIADQLLKAMRQLVTKKVVTGTWPVISMSAFTDEIESGTVEDANQSIETYGLKFARLGNFDISLDPADAAKLKELAEDIRRSQLAGGYAQMAQVEMMKGAAAGMAQGGGAVGPALMGIGMNMGGMATQQPPQSSPVPPPMQMAPQAGTQGGEASGTHPCPSCQAPVAAGAKFCGSCGTAQPATQHCTNCGSELAAGAKFCGDCGTPQGA
jgi:membrane protease subunit (stomatin/prohibitin family)